MTVTGDNTPQTVAGYLRDVHGACEKTGCGRVLVEENLAGSSLGVGEIFDVVTEGPGVSFPSCGPSRSSTRA